MKSAESSPRFHTHSVARSQAGDHSDPDSANPSSKAASPHAQRTSPENLTPDDLETPRQGPSVGRVEGVAAVLTFSFLYFLPALFCMVNHAPRVLSDPDVWWHLKAGGSILEQGTWPVSDTFSNYGAREQWAAYSWLPELLLHGLHGAFGLRGLVLYSAILGILIIAAFHRLAGILQPGILFSGALVLLAHLGIYRALTPRPWVFSILFFVVELDILLRARRSGNHRLLFWLVPVFILWANSHVQFVVGLVVLAMAVLDSFLSRTRLFRQSWDERQPPSPTRMLCVFFLCALCTLLTPYHYHLYEVALKLVGQAGALQNLIQELGSLAFRSLADWVVLAIAIAAAFAIGRRRRTPPLLILAFALSLYLGFKCRRDAWMLVIVSLIVLAYSFSPPRRLPWRFPATVRVAILVVVALLTAGGFSLLRDTRMRETLADNYPVQATEWVRARTYKGPLFNSYNWGGYLIFNLPEHPVSIDGRTMVHGVERVRSNFNTLAGLESWKRDPELRQANLIILERKFALSSILRLVPQFHLEYEDDVAVVFVRTSDAGVRDADP